MAFSVMSLLGRAKTAQTASMLDFGDAFIVHSRNKLADQFLRTKMEWMLTIDDDMVVPFGNAQLFNSFTHFNLPERFAGLHVIDRLLSHGKTLVGALYIGRWEHGKAMYGEGCDPQELKYAKSGPHDVCKPTRWVGTGCKLIHRSVFEDIEKKFPHLARGANGLGGQWFTSSEHDLRAAVEKAIAMADPAAAMRYISDALTVSKRNSSMGMGEDVQFCIRATQAGHQAHVDLGCLCGHIGSYCYGKPVK
jgi:hypothetical protein